MTDKTVKKKMVADDIKTKLDARYVDQSWVEVEHCEEQVGG